MTDRNPVILAEGMVDEVLDKFQRFMTIHQHEPNPTIERFTKAVELRKRLKESSNSLFDQMRNGEIAQNTVAIPTIEIFDHHTAKVLEHAVDKQGIKLVHEIDELIRDWAFDDKSTVGMTEENIEEMIDGVLVLQRAYFAISKVHDSLHDQHTMTHDENNDAEPSSHP